MKFDITVIFDTYSVLVHDGNVDMRIVVISSVYVG